MSSGRLTLWRKCLNRNQKKCKFLYDEHKPMKHKLCGIPEVADKLARIVHSVGQPHK